MRAKQKNKSQNSLDLILKKLNIPGKVDFLVFLGVMISGIAVTAWGIREYNYAVESINWKSAQGLIIQSYAEKDTERVSVVSESSSMQGRTRTTYTYHVVYEYKIFEDNYRGDKVRFGITVQKDLEAYPEGKEVTVYYNPDDSRHAVLEIGPPHWTVYIYYFAGGLALILGPPLYILMMMFLNTQGEKKSEKRR